MPLGSFFDGSIRTVTGPEMLHHVTIPAQNLSVLGLVVPVIPIPVVNDKNRTFFGPSTPTAFTPVFNVFCKFLSTSDLRHAKATAFHRAEIRSKGVAGRFINNFPAMIAGYFNAAHMSHGLVVASPRAVFSFFCSGNYMRKLLTTNGAISRHFRSFVKSLTSSGAEFLCSSFHVTASAVKTGARF